MKLWLDDCIAPHESHSFFMAVGRDYREWVWVKTVQEVKDALDSGEVTAVQLDHDLSETDMGHTGMDVLDYILHQIKTAQRLPPEIYIHTNHSVRAKEMRAKVKEINQYVHALMVQQKDKEDVT